MITLKKVVCIEAQPHNEVITDHILTQYGFEIRRTAHEQGTISLIQQEAPDVLLLDMCDHHEAVWDMFHQFRHSLPTRNIPIILITPRVTTIEHIRQFYAANAAGYLTKPYTPEDLLKTIDQVLS